MAEQYCPVCGGFHEPVTGGCFKQRMPPEPPPAPPQGWICPRCGSVHAPFVHKCTCKPPTWTGTTIPEDGGR
jgi:hypothetical protein